MAIASNATNDAGVSFASFADPRGRGMKPELERVEIEAAGRRDHDLAVDDAAVRQLLEQDRVQLGK